MNSGRQAFIRKIISIDLILHAAKIKSTSKYLFEQLKVNISYDVKDTNIWCTNICQKEEKKTS